MESENFKFWFPLLIAGLIGIFQLLLSWPQYKLSRLQIAEKSGKQLFRKRVLIWPIPYWVQIAAVFIVQYFAIYIIVGEYYSQLPLTRSSVVLIAVMMGIVSITFVYPIILQVYRTIEDASGDT